MKNQENQKIVDTLKSLNDNDWIDVALFNNEEECISSINLSTLNSGWYNPEIISVNGIKGFFLINQDESIFFEGKFEKKNNGFVVKRLTYEGHRKFEKKYREL